MAQRLVFRRGGRDYVFCRVIRDDAGSKTVRPDDEVAARAEILREVLGGNLTPTEGVEISNLIEVFVKKLKREESNKLWARLGERASG
jgi:hypothetical protein